MNLSAFVAPMIAAINPFVIGAIEISAGPVTAPDGTRSPTFRSFPGIPMQMQPLDSGEIEHLDGLNIQGVRRAVYMNGVIEGLERALGKGGDILVFDTQRWLVAVVLEPWDTAGWVKVAVTLQNP